MPFVCLFPLLAALNGMPQKLRDTDTAETRGCRNSRLRRAVGRASVVALVIGLGHDAIAMSLPIHDE